MSDAPDNAQNAAPPAFPMRFLGQYIRDLSFEVPHAPDIFNEMRGKQPDIPVSVDTEIKHIGASVFEILLRTNVEANIGPKSVFVVELVYASIVQIDERAIPAEQLHPVLMIEVPRLVFPFSRSIISELTSNGGFPPLQLQPIDFVELYRRKFGDQPQTIERAPAPAAAAI
ncbi:MAG: protein-export chaperone SecB [Rhodospirillaceae bacterium]|nr:protein-export chaperone SecB [Rhodospirillaceae bacterium]